MREEISIEVNAVIDEFGPQLYEDFDSFRILVPSASAPPSSGTPGIWRRKSGVGGVDAQGNLLVHPMTWIDERLFGWSRSARRHDATSRSTSRATSAHGTPEGSDDEDEFGDYENVVGYIVCRSSTTSKNRIVGYAIAITISTCFSSHSCGIIVQQSSYPKSIGIEFVPACPCVSQDGHQQPLPRRYAS